MRCWILAATCGIDPESLDDALAGRRTHRTHVIEAEEFSRRSFGVNGLACSWVLSREGSGRSGTAAAHPRCAAAAARSSTSQQQPGDWFFRTDFPWA